MRRFKCTECNGVGVAAPTGPLPLTCSAPCALKREMRNQRARRSRAAREALAEASLAWLREQLAQDAPAVRELLRE